MGIYMNMWDMIVFDIIDQCSKPWMNGGHHGYTTGNIWEYSKEIFHMGKTGHTICSKPLLVADQCGDFHYNFYTLNIGDCHDL